MTTKQYVLYTLMIMFLFLTMVTGILWFQSALELDAKNKQITALNDRKAALEIMIDGTPTNPMLGLKPQVEDPQKGLDFLLTEQGKQNNELRSSADPNSPGVKERMEQYTAQEAELKKQYEDADKAWKDFYAEWKKGNENISSALDRLKKQKDDAEKAIKQANDELATETANEAAERQKVGQERAKMSDEIKQVRLEHEETSQKVTEVSREYSKERSVTRQGVLVQADTARKTAVINIGANNGVKKGMHFNIYSGEHQQNVLKGLLEVVEAEPYSSRCVLLDFVRDLRIDPITGWTPSNADQKYSPYATTGPEETDAVELIKPKTKMDRIEGLRIDKIKKEQGLEAAQSAAAASNGGDLTRPPNEISLSLNPIAPGDWVFNANFVPVVSGAEFRQMVRDELIAMKDVNVGSLTFYIADTVRVYRKEFLRRLAQRNGCKVSDVMSPDVNVVIVGTGFTRADLLEEKLASSKGKEDVKEDVKSQRTTLAALQDAKKYAADVIAEDEAEAFFERRGRKLELLRGKAIQPGRQTFYIAGRTRDRTPEQLGHYIEDHGGLMARSIEDKVDYVVVGEKPEDAYLELIKKRGLKIIREAELPELFGEK